MESLMIALSLRSPCPDRVDVADVGISDHQLLCWEVSATRVTPTSVPVCSRVWRHLDLELFRSVLSASRLCQPDDWPDDVDEMAALYDSEISAQLDGILPMRQFVRRGADSTLQIPGSTKTVVPQSV